MIRHTQFIAGLFGLAMLASTASAEGYSVSNLGYMDSRETCRLQAELALRRYVQSDGGGEVSSATWSIYGWDLRPGDQDVVFMCPSLDAGGYQALLVVHGEGSEDQRIYTKDQLKAYFNGN